MYLEPHRTVFQFLLQPSNVICKTERRGKPTTFIHIFVNRVLPSFLMLSGSLCYPFYSGWRTPFCPYFKTGQQVTDSLSFPSPENAWISLCSWTIFSLSMGRIFLPSPERIWAWQSFSFHTWNILCHFLLDSKVSDEKPTVNFFFFQVRCCFSLTAFIFFLCFYLS